MVPWLDIESIVTEHDGSVTLHFWSRTFGGYLEINSRTYGWIGE